MGFHNLEERMESVEEREKLIKILNEIEYYLRIVQRCGYQRVGIQVLVEGVETFAYTSFNAPDGKIIKVEKGLHEPDLTARVEEAVLYEILENSEKILENPIRAAFQYGLKFKLPWKAYYKIIRSL